MMKDNTVERHRIIFVFVIFVMMFAVVAFKALKVQLLDGPGLIARAKSQFLRENMIYPKRGNIFDRDGNPLALNVQTFSLSVIPRSMSQDKPIFKKLAKIVPELSYGEILSAISGRKKYTWLARNLKLTKEQLASIRELKIISIDSTLERVYPNHEMLGQTIGFVGIDNSGLSGIEHSFDKILKGNPVKQRYTVDNKGRSIKFEQSVITSVPEAKDIYLTIDKEIQGMAEKYLKEAVIKHMADKGGIGVMDATTGEILAIANYPSYDPNNGKNAVPDNRKLSFVSDAFEPGSAFKLVTVGSALQNNVAKLTSNYFCEFGKLKVEGHTISEAESHERYEWLSVADIVKFSSNVGTTKIAFDLTFPKFKKTMKDLNFGEKTGIEIPGESRGILTEAENVSPLSLSNMSFGQGVAVTGIQLLSAYSAIANGGTYMPPTIIKNREILSNATDSNEAVATASKVARRVFRNDVASDLTTALEGVVNEGTGKEAKIEHFRIAGKTSTAQRVDRNGGYRGYVSGFVGFPVNVEKPFVIFVYVDNPKVAGYYGGAVAAPVFKHLAEYILYKNKDIKTIRNIAQENYKVMDEIKSINSSVKKELNLTAGIVPDLIGLDKISVLSIANKLNFQVLNKGIGVVVKQNPPPGSTLSSDTVVKLEYNIPNRE